MSCINIHGARSPSTIKRRYRMITRSISPLDRDKPKISYHQDNVNVAAPNSISLISNRIYSFEISRTTDPAYFLLHDLTPLYVVSIANLFSRVSDGVLFGGWRFSVYIFWCVIGTFDHRDLCNEINTEGIFWMEVIFDMLMG